jgi:glyoxylase-like metal-dependent hydrolase (beta-lactamase superfamily II)
MIENARFTIDCDRVPQFTAAYLRVAGDECAFVEAHTAHAVPKLMAALEAQGRRPEQVRWVVVTHAHLDHAAGASALLAQCPNATLLAHPRAARHLIEPRKLVASATEVYGAARFAELYGRIDPIPAERVRALEDGETFALGGSELRVHHTAGHAKHHFIVHDPDVRTVYTGDTFGLVYPALQRGVRFAIASTSPTDFDAAEAHRSLERVLSLGAEAACLTHFDAVTDLREVAAQVGAWVDRSEHWLDEAARSDEAVPAMTARIRERIRRAVEDETSRLGLAMTEADWELLAMDIDLNAQGIAFVAERRRAHPGVHP